jgi:hypothetical protein
MTKAVTARRAGDTFQARMFWQQAARLLDNKSSVVRVGFESGPKGFDDIRVDYDPERGMPDQNGNPIRREYIQCKWHVSHGVFGYNDLINPQFTNATARSLLQKARTAQISFASDGIGIRFKLATNWCIDCSDPLCYVTETSSGTIDPEYLFESKRNTRAIGALRKAWQEHLAIDENDLRSLARTLAFSIETRPLEALRHDLDYRFGFVGLRRIPDNESAFLYDDLVFQWMAQGRQEFDRLAFRQICDQQGLFSKTTQNRTAYGVKTFEHSFDRLEDHCVDVLNLISNFHNRYIRNDADWPEKLYPQLTTFLSAAADKNPDRLRLALDAHATLAFAAGSILDTKCGRNIELEQRTPSKRYGPRMTRSLIRLGRSLSSS